MTGAARKRNRVLVIGLDCVPPSLFFDKYRSVMPTVARMMHEGNFGPLRSTTPPITVPAWTSMVTGLDPGELGLYGFRNRIEDSYELRIADSRDIAATRIWDELGKLGKHVCALFVPPSYPPTPLLGEMVSCFLTPDASRPHTYPPLLTEELSGLFGPYILDVANPRGDDKQRILDDIYAMTRQHFAIARHLWQSRDADFLMMVEMGPDRFHHAFWDCIDESHPLYDPNNYFRDEGEKYYAFIDAQISAFLELVDENTTVIIVSDHGAKALQGGACINQWLIDQEWLALITEPEPASPLRNDMVDWSRTRAWAEGGYYSRVFLNVAGREPEGIVPMTAYNAERQALRACLEEFPLPTQVLEPERLYKDVRGLAPDLQVFFDDLNYRAIGTVGHANVITKPDDPSYKDNQRDTCNHDWDGIYLEWRSKGSPVTPPPRHITDVYMRLLELSGQDAG